MHCIPRIGQAIMRPCLRLEWRFTTPSWTALHAGYYGDRDCRYKAVGDQIVYQRELSRVNLKYQGYQVVPQVTSLNRAHKAARPYHN